jgi:hypothetical protein
MAVERVRIILIKPGLYVTFPAAGKAVNISFINLSLMYGSTDYTKSPASGIATVSEPMFMPQVGGSARICLRVDQFVSAIGAVGAPVLLRNFS